MTHDGPPDFSFVSPVYRCREALAELHHGIAEACRELGKTFELILVDDRCPQNSWDAIRELGRTHPEVIGVRLSRNFGQHQAIEAGLRHSRGEWVVVLDCDLQDPPAAVPELFAKAQEGWKVVRARRQGRQDPLHRRFASFLFYRLLGYLSGTPQDPGLANYGIYHRTVIDALCSWHESVRFFPSTVSWIGFEQTTIDISHAARHSGTSSYSLRKLLQLALEVIITSSDKPLKHAFVLGLSVSALSFLYALITIGRYLASAIIVPGWTTVIVSVWFFSGLIIGLIGLAGLYIGRTLREARGRPTYICAETINLPKGEREVPAYAGSPSELADSARTSSS